MILLLLVIATTLCCGNDVEKTVFAKEWELFKAQKKIDFDRLNTPAYRNYEFLLLEDFSAKQMPRQRQPIQGIDRYVEWVPFIENKVTLHDGTEMSASFVHLADKKDGKYHNFIASQAPEASNIYLFWQMVWENCIDQIVMTTELLAEDGEEFCVLYWPQKVGEKLVYENGIEVTLLEEKPEEDSLQIRKLNVRYNNQDKSVTHFWHRNWPQGGVPNTPHTMMILAETLRKNKACCNPEAPILVHCAAGVGRTGVFIVLYHIMQRIENGDDLIPLFELVAHLRWQRADMVGDFIQYEFCFQAMQEIYNNVLR